MAILGAVFDHEERPCQFDSSQTLCPALQLAHNAWHLHVIMGDPVLKRSITISAVASMFALTLPSVATASPGTSAESFAGSESTVQAQRAGYAKSAKGVLTSRAAKQFRVTIAIQGLDGSAGAVTVRGPKIRGSKRFTVRLQSTRTLRGLRPGKYTVTASRVWFGADPAVPSRTKQTFRVKKRGKKRIIVSYQRVASTPDPPRDCSVIPANDLAGCDLRGVDLSGRDLREVNLDGADLRNANLSGATFSWRLRHVNLAGANLSGSDLSDTSIDWCNLTGANLSGTRVGQVSGEFSNVNISGAHLEYAYFDGISTRGGIVGTPATAPMHADWGRIIGSFMISRSTVFHDAELSGIDFAGVNLSNSSIINSNVAGTRFVGATLGADPSSAILDGRWIRAGTKSAGLSGVPANLPTAWRLTRGYLIGPGTTVTGGLWGYQHGGLYGQLDTRPAAHLAGVNLAGADMRRSMFSHPGSSYSNKVPVCRADDSVWDPDSSGPGCGVDFTDANLSNTNLSGTVLTGARLVGTNLRGANLVGAYLNASYIQGIDLRDANLTGIQAYGLTGTPAYLPAGWSIVDGRLVGG